MMAYILSIETATETCSAALHAEGKLLASRVVREARSHSKVLNQLMLEVLDEAKVTLSQVQAIAVSKGPGSYTGLRIGVATAKGICFANDIPLIAVNTLQTMAAAIDTSMYNNDVLLCPMIDARRMEVYLNLYSPDLLPQSETEAVILEEKTFEMKLSQQQIVFFGNGMDKWRSLVSHTNAMFVDDIEPLAENMGQLAFEKFNNKAFESVAYFEPFYLKDFRITPAKK